MPEGRIFSTSAKFDTKQHHTQCTIPICNYIHKSTQKNINTGGVKEYYEYYEG